MTQIAAIAMSLLKGDVLTIMDGFKRFACTNLPRELSRSIEQKFGVEISRVKKEFKAQFDGRPGYYYQYRLNNSDHNREGIDKMREYLRSQIPNSTPPKTDKEAKQIRQTNLLLNF
jgi:hypothetical protein